MLDTIQDLNLIRVSDNGFKTPVRSTEVHQTFGMTSLTLS